MLLAPFSRPVPGSSGCLDANPVVCESTQIKVAMTLTPLAPQPASFIAKKRAEMLNVGGKTT